MNSAQQIIPQLQHLQVGDRIPMIAGEEVGPLVKELEPNRRMLWWDGKGEFTWEWLLEPLDDRTTRLLTRVQETYPPLWSRRMLYAVVASSGDIVMVRKQRRGIKARAERLGGGSPEPRTPGGIHLGPGTLVKATRLLSYGGATAAAGLMAYGAWTAVAWARYGAAWARTGRNWIAGGQAGLVGGPAGRIPPEER